jgi:hypothetical protein
MNDTETYADAVAYLRRALDYMEADQSIWKYLKSRDAVLDRFKPTFSPENLPQLRQDEFHAFLLLENNKHWSGLHRHSPKMCADMDLLRSALTILLDESQPVEHRLDQATTRVTGMGKAVATAILLITHPDRYGVWNSTSEGGLKALIFGLGSNEVHLWAVATSRLTRHSTNWLTIFRPTFGHWIWRGGISTACPAMMPLCSPMLRA